MRTLLTHSGAERMLARSLPTVWGWSNWSPPSLWEASGDQGSKLIRKKQTQTGLGIAQKLCDWLNSLVKKPVLPQGLLRCLWAEKTHPRVARQEESFGHGLGLPFLAVHVLALWESNLSSTEQACRWGWGLDLSLFSSLVSGMLPCTQHILSKSSIQGLKILHLVFCSMVPSQGRLCWWRDPRQCLQTFFGGPHQGGRLWDPAFYRAQSNPDQNFKLEKLTGLFIIHLQPLDPGAHQSREFGGWLTHSLLISSQ
jgi:hypothetical protein